MVTVSFTVPSKLHTCYILMESFYLCVSPAAALQPSFSFLGQALTLLVTVSSMHYCTSTPALSRRLQGGLLHSMGHLILRGLRLDAPGVARTAARQAAVLRLRQRPDLVPRTALGYLRPRGQTLACAMSEQPALGPTTAGCVLAASMARLLESDLLSQGSIP